MPIPAANPSMPSMRLNALIIATNRIMVKSTLTKYGILCTPKVPKREVILRSLPITIIEATKICTVSFFKGAKAKMSSFIPMKNKMTKPAKTL